MYVMYWYILWIFWSDLQSKLMEEGGGECCKMCIVKMCIVVYIQFFMEVVFIRFVIGRCRRDRILVFLYRLGINYKYI